MPTNCLILEDEAGKSQLLQGFLNKKQHNCTVVVNSELEKVVHLLQEESTDLFFIVQEQFESIDFQFIQKINHPPRIVVHSSRPEMAIAAFQINAFDFLPQPLALSDFNQLMEKYSLSVQGQHKNEMPQTHFFVKADYRIVRVDFNELLYIEGMGEYVRLHTTTQKVVSLLSLSKLISILPQKRFFRIHRSYIINIDKINFIQNNIVSIGTHQLTISKSRKQGLYSFIDTHGLL